MILFSNKQNILKIYVKKFVSIKIICKFVSENESKNINLKKITL